MHLVPDNALACAQYVPIMACTVWQLVCAGMDNRVLHSDASYWICDDTVRLEGCLMLLTCLLPQAHLMECITASLTLCLT